MEIHSLFNGAKLGLCINDHMRSIHVSDRHVMVKLVKVPGLQDADLQQRRAWRAGPSHQDDGWRRRGSGPEVDPGILAWAQSLVYEGQPASAAGNAKGEERNLFTHNWNITAPLKMSRWRTWTSQRRLPSLWDKSVFCQHTELRFYCDLLWITILYTNCTLTIL